MREIDSRPLPGRLRRRRGIAGARPASVAPLLWLTALGGLALLVSLPILPGVLWALMLGYWTFPLHRRIAARMSPCIAAGLSTILLVSVTILPTIWLVNTTQEVFEWIQESLPENLDVALSRLHAFTYSLPFVGKALQLALPGTVGEIDWVGMGTTSANALGAMVAATLVRAGNWVFHAVIGIGSLFFVYRDGPSWWALLCNATAGAFGNTGTDATALVRQTASAVTRGVILTAVAQGILAGLGYWAAGAPQPVLLALVTIPAAVVPLGAALVWLPAAAWLALSGSVAAGLGLAIWGILAVSTVDNALRPMLMHHSTPLSFWPLTLSIVGGTLALGLPGVYIGPISYALAHMVLIRVSNTKVGVTPMPAAEAALSRSTGPPAGGHAQRKD